MIDKIDFYQEYYKKIDWEIYNFASREERILSLIKSELKWQDLTDDEKQAKRVGIIKKVSLRLTEDRKDTFLLEETVNMVYSLCEEALNRIEILKNEKELDVLIKRLEAMLFIEKILINEFFEAKRIRSFNYRELDNILNEIIKSDQHQKFNEGLSLELLKEKVNLKYQLLNASQEHTNLPQKPLS